MHEGVAAMYASTDTGEVSNEQLGWMTSFVPRQLGGAGSHC